MRIHYSVNMVYNDIYNVRRSEKMSLSNSMSVFIPYFMIINLTTFILFAIDKKRSKTNKWRIPEARLLIFSFIGGGIGGFIGMMIFRHKTKKPKFTIGMPILIILNILAAIYIIK